MMRPVATEDLELVLKALELSNHRMTHYTRSQYTPQFRKRELAEAVEQNTTAIKRCKEMLGRG